MKFRRNFNDTMIEEKRLSTACDCQNSPLGESRTQQAPARGLDINEIARRFGMSDFSQLPAFDSPALYGDASNFPTTYEEAYQLLERSHNTFMTLPATVREKFHNNYREFVPWIQDEKNWPEAAELKLLSSKYAAKPATASQTPAQGSTSSTAQSSPAANTAT